MSRVRQLMDSAVLAMERRKRRQEQEEREAAAVASRSVYDMPPSKAEQEAMRAALSVPHGEPWLRGVVDVVRQLQQQHLDTMAARPTSPDAAEATVRYSELRRFEAVLLATVEKAWVGARS